MYLLNENIVVNKALGLRHIRFIAQINNPYLESQPSSKMSPTWTRRAECEVFAD